MQASMSKTAYKNMLNNVGDILEAVSAIACSQTPNAEPVRKHLKMTKVDADRIVACLGALFEYANLLIRSCGLSEQDVFEELKVRHMDALVNLERLWITSKRPLSEAAPDLMSIEQPAVRHRSSAASSSSGSVPRLPQDVFDTRFSHEKKTKYFHCDRCSERMSNNGQGIAHLGDWVESKKGQPIIDFEKRWKAGENFTWYCLECLCKHLGYGDDPRSKRMVLQERGLLFHANNRDRRYADHKRKIAEADTRKKRKF